MSVLYLTEAQVQELLDMPQALATVEEAFRQLALGQAMNVPRKRARAPGVILHTMSAAASYLGAVGWKAYTTTRSGAKFHVGLYSQKSGELLALIEADHLGRLRTGATTGVAAKYLALPDADRLGLFGSGRQAETQLRALHVVRPLKHVVVHSFHFENALAFAARMSAQLGIDVQAVPQPQLAVEHLPLVVTATTATEPIFNGRWLSEGTFVAAIGGNALNRAEIDATVVRRAEAIVCDSVEACQGEAGDFVDAAERSIFHWNQAIDLGRVVIGQVTPRKTPKGIMLFKSVGVALEDVALASKLVELARARQIGLELPI